MVSRKRVLSGKRMLAGILTAVMVISSAQLPMSAVYAEDLAESSTVTENEDDFATDQSAAEEGEIESGPEEETTDSNEISDAAGEGLGDDESETSGDDQSGDQTEESDAPDEEEEGSSESGGDEETPSDDENIADDENIPDGDEEDAGGLEEGLRYPAQISENNITAEEQPETIVQGEIEGVYQFGGAPAKRGNLSVYSESTYSEDAEEYLYEQILARNESINVFQYKIPIDVWGDFVSGVINEHPDLYFVEKRYQASVSGSYLYTVNLTYNNTLDDAAVQRGIGEALATVDETMSPLEKAIVLHDYLVVNCEYDKENLDAGTVPNESHTIYGVFAKRMAVCDGYALAYKYLLKQVGIDCYMVTSDSMNHAWNMIVLDGQYYQVDVTWDDPTWDKIGRAVHTYMFRSDSAFAKHQDWRITYGSQTVDYKATDTRYDNAFWTECDSPLVLVGDDCYYVSFDSVKNEGVIKKGTLANFTDGGTAIQSIDCWTVWGNPNSYWQGAYSGLFRVDDRLYYNDKSSIYSIAMDGTDKRTEFTADTSTGYIYGSAYYQGNVLYALHQTPNLNGRETVLVASMGGSGSADIPVQLVELSAYTLELAEGDEAGLSVTVYPAYATDSAVVWTSDDEKVATVTDGRVCAVSVGSCTVTATAGGKKAECTIQVKGALNLNNLSYEYTTVDDVKITSAAEGRPKLLIFYSNTCGNCRNTIWGISNKIDQFAGIDIYAMETNNGTKEAVAEFQSQYGCEEITFSYDIDGTNQNSMWAYARTGGINAGGTISWPVICYIDADNRLQYMTTSYIAADEIRSNLKEYCNAAVEAPQIYTITYVLNGGTNSVYNPSTYTSETDTIILQNATRDGYRFEGWYKDSAYMVRATQIAKGSTGNITLYAKWSELSDTGLPEVDMSPSDGNVVMGFSGTYYTESADKILNRLNAIRQEACKQGVKNPRTGSPLTMNDYVPLKWSSDLEAIARIRAAEASVNNSHIRLNESSCFTVVTNNGVKSVAENLAWNSEGLMAGIEQWYDEKSNWVNQSGGQVGHYTSIINPEYTYVGLGAFRLSTGGWYSVAQEFSRSTSMDERKNDTKGKCVQYLEVAGGSVKKLEFDKDMAGFIREGDSYKIPLNVTAAYSDYYGNVKNYSGPYQAGGRWYSSDQNVALVDGTGMVTALAKGTTTITFRGGIKSAAAEITVYGMNESPIRIQRPDKTTYKVGQKLDVTGAKVTYVSGTKTVTENMKASMVSGFDSTKPGLCTVTVTCGGYAVSFDTLIIAEPELTADCGWALSEIPLPENAYGTYAWQDNTQIIDKVGIHTYGAVFTPYDKALFQELTDLKIQVTAQMELGSGTEITFKSNTYTYSGANQEPKVVVSIPNAVLVEEQDYTLTYQNNKNTGTATVFVQGINYYRGSLSKTFEIMPARLEIKAKDKAILIDERIPAGNEYEYEVNGLMTGDSLIVMPSFSCGIVNSAVAGRYEIVPYGADAGANYIITYGNGRLTVASEYVSCIVTFDAQGHGAAPADYFDIKVGDTIDRPDDPSEAGYRFDGWYKDAACTKAWNFDMDIVQSDMTLYAKWLGGSMDGEFTFQEITDVYYTGKACKPAVSVYDGDTLLKSGRDYQIKYYNNVNANKGGVRKQGNGEGIYFNADLPYVEIIGKGNYTDRIKDGDKDTVKVNFNILRTSIGDGSSQAADGIVLKVSDQLVTAKKEQKPFTSIKYVKGMKKDTDFKVSLTVENARDQSGRSLQMGLELENAVVPAGYSGEFLLTVEGVNNYEGSICREIHVADKAHLIKNATITIGKNLKNITFTGKPVQLEAGETNSADNFTVKYGKTFLKPGRDYTVSYRNNDRVGKAELIITGMGEYTGSKTANFNIKGRSFTAKTVLVEDIKSKVYTGRAITQNGVKLTYGAGDEAPSLQYGTDYTISYSKNINKGTATMTFKGVANAGYSGSFKKTFKITAADIAQVNRSETMQNMVFSYCKAGVKPVNEILLTNQEGFTLRNGKDYTLKYTNNKAVASASGDKPPTVTVKGKGNYAGEFSLNFDIIRADLRAGSIQIKTTPVAYQENKAEDYAYKPAVKLTDGKTALRVGKDYVIEYRNNTQADYERYIQNLQGQAGGSLPQDGELTMEDDVPMAVITEAEGSSYRLDQPIIVSLPIYQVKLKKTNLAVEIGEAVYTGSQVTPEVTVTYDGMPLREGQDYSLSYGANTASGKKKGSVVINGIAPNYGGSVTVKFDITKKPISY